MTMRGPFDLMVKHLWPTSIFHCIWNEHPDQAPSIVEFLHRLKRQQSAPIASGIAPRAKSGKGLYESHFDLLEADHPGLRKLKSFLAESVCQAAARVNGYESVSDLRSQIDDSWFHIANDGGFHDAHFHGECSWCGIYYLVVGASGVPTDSGAPNGGNRFYSPLASGGRYKDLGNTYLDLTYVDPPLRDGMLILFPSYLLHCALPYRGSVDRIVIAFNSKVLPA
jgi:uncharacterized protein (TIGR02466 family)